MSNVVWSFEMAGSYRKTPISGITKKNRDKQYKTAEHKRARRKIKETDLTTDIPANPQTFGNLWAGRFCQ